MERDFGCNDVEDAVLQWPANVFGVGEVYGACPPYAKPPLVSAPPPACMIAILVATAASAQAALEMIARFYQSRIRNFNYA